MYNPIFVSKEILNLNPDTNNPNMGSNALRNVIAVGVASLALVGCSFQQEQAESEPSEVTPIIESKAETATPETSTSVAPEAIAELTPEAKLEKLNQQLKDLFMKVYTGEVPGEFSLNIQKGEKYSGTRYYEATAGKGEEQITVSMETHGSDSVPLPSEATFVGAKLSAVGVGPISPDSPEGEVVIAEVNSTNTSNLGPQINGLTELGGTFDTRGANGRELNRQSENAQKTILTIAGFIW